MAGAVGIALFALASPRRGTLRGDADAPALRCARQSGSSAWACRVARRSHAREGEACDGALPLGRTRGFVAADARGPRRFRRRARCAFRAAGGALFDVSASYVGWRVAGERAARVLNRLVPLDLDPRVFVPGSCAQSVLGRLGATLYRPGDAPAFVVLVARSYADDALHAIEEAAAP